MNKTDQELISALQSFSGVTQILAAINLAKIDRFDIINAAKIPGLDEKLQASVKFREIMTKKTDLEKWSGEAGARVVWEDNMALREEYNNDYESYLAYCKAVNIGLI
jgi:hypothetical protein